MSLEASPIGKMFKRAISILQKPNHDEALARIRDGVSALHKVAGSNMELECSRKSRSDGRLHKLVKRTLDSIYRASQSAIACKCTSPHDPGLRLTPPSRTVIPDDDDDDDKETEKELQFCLAVMYTPQSTALLPRRWNDNNIFVLRYFPEGTLSTAMTSLDISLLYLGKLLIELILGQLVTNLESSQSQTVKPGLPRHVLDYNSANKLLGRVMMEGAMRIIRRFSAGWYLLRLR